MVSPYAIALAPGCDNVRRAAPKGDTSSGPIVKGDWEWLPSIGVDEDAWGFVPPGTEPAGPLLGKPHSWVGVSGQCDPSKTTSRQTEHRVLTGCF